MFKYFIITLVISFQVHGDVLLYEDDIIRFRLSNEWEKRAGSTEQLCRYGSADGKRLVVQLFRHRKWSQWHMKGLNNAKKTFQKYFDSSFGGSTGDVLEEILYDKEKYILSLHWRRLDKSLFVSKMKLTSFGCVAFHMPCSKESLVDVSKELDVLAQELEIPKHLKFVPEDITKEILENMGGGVAFIFLSITYLMFSLFKRSQLRSQRLERRLADAKKGPIPLPNKGVSLK
jgi:hypothetical protein